MQVDQILAARPYHALKLSSAASFRRNGAEFRRDRDGHGWGEQTTRTLSPYTAMLKPLSKGVPFSIGDEENSEPGLPPGFKRPVLAIPAANPIRCFGLSLYGPHASGADLDT